MSFGAVQHADGVDDSQKQVQNLQARVGQYARK